MMADKRFNPQDYGNNDPWPGLPTTFTVYANIINDGKDISINIPREFAGLRLSIDRHDNGMWYLYLEANETAGKKVIEGTGEHSYIRFPVTAFPELKIRPAATSYWNSRRMGSRILIGKLLTHLSFGGSAVSPQEISWGRYKPERPSPKLENLDNETDEEEVEKEMVESQKLPPVVLRTDMDTDKPGLTDLIVNPQPTPGTFYVGGKHIEKKPEKLSLPAFKQETTVADPQKTKPEIEMLKQALALINNAITAGTLGVRVKADGTIAASVVTTVDP